MTDPLFPSTSRPPDGAILRAAWAPFDVVIFDCDSTLVDIEGIDELARWQGRGQEVADLTRRAMDGALPLEAVYGRRLHLLQPTRDELRRLAHAYRDRLLPDAAAVVAALQSSGVRVYIVSGGLAEAVAAFGAGLGLPPENIMAVQTDYDALSGRWWESWKHPLGHNPDEKILDHDGGPLTMGAGKTQVIQHLRARQRGRAILVGDGVSDLEASGAVDLFVGFGGVAARARVRDEAPVYVHTASLSPILPLALAAPVAHVPGNLQPLYADGVARLRDGSVTIQNQAARDGLLSRLEV